VKENVYATDLDAFIQNKGIRKEVELTAKYP
jgi:hypothetical protein